MNADNPKPSAERRALDADIARDALDCIQRGYDDPERRRRIKLFVVEKAMRDLMTYEAGRCD